MTSPAKPQVLVGTYGFAYKEWVGPFYPKTVPAEERLRYYAGVFGAVEMVHTYYGAPKPNAVALWRAQTPAEFKISIKLPRWVTARAQRAERAVGLADDLGRMLDVLDPLGPRLGPLVLQLDEGFEYPHGLAALSAFLTGWKPLSNRAQLAIAFQHQSWFVDGEPEALLRDSDVAWVWNDTEPQPDDTKRVPRAIDDPAALRDTSSKIIYVRLSGSHEGKQTHYTPRVDRSDELRRWAELVNRQLKARLGRTAYVLLSDHYAGVGPDTAREVQALLKA